MISPLACRQANTAFLGADWDKGTGRQAAVGWLKALRRKDLKGVHAMKRQPEGPPRDASLPTADANRPLGNVRPWLR